MTQLHSFSPPLTASAFQPSYVRLQPQTLGAYIPPNKISLILSIRTRNEGATPSLLPEGEFKASLSLRINPSSLCFHYIPRSGGENALYTFHQPLLAHNPFLPFTTYRSLTLVDSSNNVRLLCRHQRAASVINGKTPPIIYKWWPPYS